MEDIRKSKIEYNKIFIKSLLDKLKVGNRRGIHLNAIPGYSRSRLDIKELDNIKEGKSEEFLNTLLNTEDFSFVIDFDGIDLTKMAEDDKNKLSLVSRKLNNITIDNEDMYLETGIKNFGFGYPIIVRPDSSDPTKIIKAPLFIWNLDIERSNRKNNSWKISRTVDHPIRLNELLRSHILKDSQIELESLSSEILEDNIVDEKELIGVCGDILSQLNDSSYKDKKIDLKIEKCPTKQKIESLVTESAWVQCSGVFGIYTSRKESVIKRTEHLLENFKDFQNKEVILDKFQTSTVSAVSTDPSKEEIINSLTSHEIKLIQGPPGTGKSQALTAIISNVLESGGKCLVVCEKRTALEVIQNNLKKIGLSDRVALIDDISKDRSRIVKQARNIVDSSRYYYSFNESQYEESYKRFAQLRDKYNKKHLNERSNKIDDDSWKDAIGRFIQFVKDTDWEKIKEIFPKYDVELNNKDNYLMVEDSIQDAIKAFDYINNDSHKLFFQFNEEILNNSLTRKKSDEILDLLKDCFKSVKQVRTFIEKLKESDIQYNEISIFSIENILKEIEKKEKELKVLNELSDKIILLEKSISKKDKIYLSIKDRLFKVFASKNTTFDLKDFVIKTISKNKEYRECFIKNTTVKEITLDVVKRKNNQKTKKISQELEKLNDINNIYNKIIEFETKYNASVNQVVSKKISVEDFNNLQDFKDKIDKSFIFLKDSIQSFDSFEASHNWIYYFNSLNGIQNEIITKFIESNIPSKQWLSSLRAWRYYHLLSDKEDGLSEFHTEDSDLISMSDLYKSLESNQVELIKSRLTDSLRGVIPNNFRLLYNLRKNRISSRANSLRKIVEKDFDLFTSIFPVVLTNPLAVDSIFPLEPGIFDVVIFDEASQLRIEDTFTSLIRGKYKIIAGDKHQMPPSSYFETSSDLTQNNDLDDEDKESEYFENSELALSESLLDYAENLGFQSQSYLDYHYRSQHPALIDFSNMAFYGGNLVPFPEKFAYNPIEFNEVNGIYEDRTNNAEVEKVIDVIRNEIHSKEDGNYPSVGIATFNIPQRNKIIDAINEESIKDSKFGDKMERIRNSENGLFIKNLENIQGDEMDIIILSTTYGKDRGGKFFERFGPLNLEKGYKLLNVLVTRAKDKIIICTSIPREKYNNYNTFLEEFGNNRKAVLYAYLNYAKSISDNNLKSADQVKEDLLIHSHDRPRNINIKEGLVESPFEQEVYDCLLEKFESKNITPQKQIGGFRVDFLLEKNNSKIIIECDGKAYHSSNEAYAHDMFRQEELENLGYKVYRIWSTNWWRNHTLEINKLLEYVEKI